MINLRKRCVGVCFKGVHTYLRINIQNMCNECTIFLKYPKSDNKCHRTRVDACDSLKHDPSPNFDFMASIKTQIFRCENVFSSIRNFSLDQSVFKFYYRQTVARRACIRPCLWQQLKHKYSDANFFSISNFSLDQKRWILETDSNVIFSPLTDDHFSRSRLKSWHGFLYTLIM